MVQRLFSSAPGEYIIFQLWFCVCVKIITVLYLEQAKCVCSDGFQPTVKASHLETADSPFSKLPSNRSSSGDGSSLSSNKIFFCVIMLISASWDSIFFHNPQCLLGWSVVSEQSKQWTLEGNFAWHVMWNSSGAWSPRERRQISQSHVKKLKTLKALVTSPPAHLHLLLYLRLHKAPLLLLQVKIRGGILYTTVSLNDSNIYERRLLQLRDSA